MSRIPQAFRRLVKSNEAALIPYLTAGYPSLQATRTLLPVIARQGADMIALGVGSWLDRIHSPGIPEASLSDCLSLAAEARRSNEVALLLVSSYNSLLDQGIENLLAEVTSSGVDGLIVPDLSLEDTPGFKAALEVVELDLILTLPPAATGEHLKRVAALASGFILCGPVTSIEELSSITERVRLYTELPLVAAFDVGTPEQVACAGAFTNGVLVPGAPPAVVEGLPEDDLLMGVSDFVRTLKEATARPSEQ